MNTVNHAATGALIAIALDNPVAALPLAFISHFVLDALPHFGYKGHGGYGAALKHRLTYGFLFFDLVGLLVLVYVLWGQPFLILLSCIIAVTPDVLHVYRYFWFERRGLKPPAEWFAKWHRRIQWCERPWGFALEVVFAGLALYLLWELK